MGALLRWHRLGNAAEEIAGMPVVTAAEMREAEAALFARGTPSFDVMGQAGQAVVEAIQMRWPGRFRQALVLCGPGNNGGDGFIIARELAALGWTVRVAAALPLDDYRGDAGRAAVFWGGEFLPLDPRVLNAAEDRDTLVVDAVFGIGLSRPLEGAIKALVETLAHCQSPLVAVDVPSGLDADTGEILGAAPRAALTVTFGWPKPGHLLLPGRGLIGDLAVADVGCRAADIPSGACLRVNGVPVWRSSLPIPTATDHKYTRGHAVIAGGTEMPGAARLASRSARRAGIGMLTVAAPKSAHSYYLGDQPGLIVESSEDANDFKALLADRRVTSVLVGSGLPPNARTRGLVEAAAEAGRPLVIDGGGLTAFAEDWRALARFGRPDIVLTPHAGEFARLFPHLSALRGKLARARAAAAESGCTMILKGADTVIAAPDGASIVNADAPAWLATAGSGDVLAGLVLGLLGQGIRPSDAAAAAVSLHGMAATAFGPGLIAEDIPEQLPGLFRNLIGSERG